MIAQLNADMYSGAGSLTSTDYSAFGNAVTQAIIDAGITVSVDNRPFGRLVRGYVNA